MIIFNSASVTLATCFLLVSFTEVSTSKIKTYYEYNKNVQHYKVQPPRKITKLISAENMLNHRISNLVYNDDDINLIDKYANEFLSISDINTLEQLEDHSALLRKIIKLIQLPNEQLQLLQKYAISLKYHKYTKEHRIISNLKQIIWWSEVRTIGNRKDLVSFLNRQMNTFKRSDVIKLFIEKGMVKELQDWSVKLKFKDSEIIFSVAVRQAKIRKAFLEKKHDMIEILINEISKSIYEFFPFIDEDKKNIMRYDHISWLFKQLGIYRNLKGVNIILKNLVNEELFYNKETLEQYTPEKLEEFYKEYYKYVSRPIYEMSIRALNPFDVIEFQNKMH